MGSVWQDIRYALRMMVKTPGLTSVLIVTLALGIGASTTIFSVVNSVVLRPLPYEQPDQLARVYTEFYGKMDLHKFWVSWPEFDDLRRDCRTCESVGAWARGTASIAGGDRPVRVEAGYVTHELLPLLGVKPILGRWFDASEDLPGDPTTVVLGYDIWQRAFAGDPAVIGRKIHVDAIPVTVIGVMPKGFDFLDRLDAWMPANVDFKKANRGGHNAHVVVRLKPGQSVASLSQELDTLADEWSKHDGPTTHVIRRKPNPTTGGAHPMIAVPFQDDLVGSLASTLWLLQGAVLFVLLIAIVNIANLLLARAETRTREVAVRHALGASRRRLVRQFVTESLILGLFGGALGILVAVWAVDGVTALIPRSAPRANEIALDGAAVAFAVGCSIVAALLFGLAPIVHARRTDLHGALKDGSNRMTGSRARLRVRRALVIAEIALAVVLVIGCTVMVRSFLRLQKVDIGFQPDHVLTFGIELPTKTYAGDTGDPFWHRLHDRLSGLPGVTSAGLVMGVPPVRRLNANDMSLPGRNQRDADEPVWNVDYWQIISEDGLDALGARVVKGRGLTKADGDGAPNVLLVNEAFVAKFFKGRDPIGQKVQVAPNNPGEFEPPEQTVVGVVADIKQAGVDQPAGTEVFVPLWQYTGMSKPRESQPTMYAVLRTTGDSADLIPAVHRIVGDIDPTLPLFQVRSMNDILWEAVARPRFLTFLLTAFAGLALLLAAVGIYGVMSHTVAQRTHEIGLRVALGAQPAQVRSMVLRQAGTLVVFGIGAGLAVAIGLSMALSSSLTGMFYGSQLAQPELLAGVAVAVAATALLATWIPARRATRVQPTVALRSE
ncbi:MAG TPA: ABC transporter permease [Kofleriaceae bacterium]|jgi:putative ABC transport system permease protein|nr:ABC transporter permease [Kofleriaceae bacterium]